MRARAHARERMLEPASGQPTDQPTNQPASQRGCPHTDRTHAQTRPTGFSRQRRRRRPKRNVNRPRAAAARSRLRVYAPTEPARPSDQDVLTARSPGRGDGGEGTDRSCAKGLDRGIPSRTVGTRSTRDPIRDCAPRPRRVIGAQCVKIYTDMFSNRKVLLCSNSLASN